MNPVVRSTHECPSCEHEEAFTTKVCIGDYAEMVPHKGASCERCGYQLTEEQEAALLTAAWESGPEDYAGEMADYLYDRSRDR